MLAESLTKAFGTADRMLSLARKANGGASLPGVLADSSGGRYDQQTSITYAREQYRHNRGWVYACVRLIATRVAGQPIHVGREVATHTSPNAAFVTKDMAGKRVEPLESHALLDLLADPWELGTAWSLIFMTVASLELTGRALWYVTENSGRRTILPIPTSWIESVDRKRSIWKIRPDNYGQSFDLEGDRVAYFFYPDPSDPWNALSPLQAMAGAVHTDEAITQAHWRTFSQGMHPGLVVTVGREAGPPGSPHLEGQRPNLTPEQRLQIINAIRRHLSGAAKAGEPIILDGLIESVEKFTLTPAELDFLNSAKLSKSKICQGYGVSPILLGEIEGANRASATVADEIFVANKVNPLIALLSQTLTEFLSPMFAASGEKLRIWIEDAVPRDSELQFKAWSLGLTRGAVTFNEYRRAMLKLPDIAGGDELPDSASPPAIDLAAVKAIAAASNPYANGSRINGKPAGSLETAARRG